MDDLSKYWWEEPSSTVHETLFGILRFFEQNQNYRSQANLRHMRLYGNLNILGLAAHNYAQSQVNAVERVSLNIIQSMCDTVTNKLGKNRPKPTFLVEGGDYALKRKAKHLDKFIQGQFYALNLYALGARVVLDSTVFGTGALKIYREGMEIKAERVFTDELQVDDTEALYGKPRSLYQTKSMPREVMVKLYPGFKREILEAEKADPFHAQHTNLSNNIRVCEAWHLPSSPDAMDGRHVISIGTATLVSEPYTRSYFPFVFQRWNERLLGFWGQGLAEQLTGLQVEINKILMIIQRAFHLLGVPKVLIEASSKIVKAHINNEIGGIISYTGMKPEVIAASPVAAELFNHLERLYQKAYEVAGISQLSAQAKKPEGLDSGKAIRTYNDIESERFILVGQRYEQLFMDATKQIIDLTREIAQEDPDYAVKVKGGKFLETIRWKDIDLEEDQYQMQIFPTSMLSETPEGKLSDITDLIQAGFIDKPNALKLLDFPDLDGYMSLANAPIDDIENLISNIIEKGEYQPPEPFQDLSLGIKMMQSAYLRAKTDLVEEEKLELMRRWMSEAQAKLSPPMPAPPPLPNVPGLPGGTPQAVPQAPPESNLLPNAPQ
jgi:hypothetical protein